MSEVDLTLVLSGHLCRPESADMRPFWRGFIELQRKLPSSRKVRHIAAHSWNPELADLARFVYGSDVERHESQNSFSPEFVNSIDPPDLFELGLDRLNSTWRNVSLQTVLGNARSRARAVQLLEKLPVSEGQVLLTRWDLGQTGSVYVNQLVVDVGLPNEYLYFAYYPQVDEGYADMWILGPWALVNRFGKFDEFVLNSLSGKNAYLAQFCETGWPYVWADTPNVTIQRHPIGRRIHRIAVSFGESVVRRTGRGNLLSRLLSRSLRPLKRALDSPFLTAENSYIPEASRLPKVFPKYVALNIHALLKYFILTKDLRQRTRFIAHDDFEIASQSGQVINPQPLLLLIWDMDEDEETALNRLLVGSPLPVAAVIHVAEVVRIWKSDKRASLPISINPNSCSSRDSLLCALDFAEQELGGLLPYVIMPTVGDYLSCTDWFYLNALLKFIAFKNLDYVGLNSNDIGKPSLQFPDLSLARGGAVFSLRSAMGTVSGVHSLVNSDVTELADLCDRINKMQIEFPAVCKDKVLFC
jgi:hypothetical protein